MTNEEAAREAVERARVALDDNYVAPDPVRFNIPYDDSMTETGWCAGLQRAEELAIEHIDAAFREIGWYPVHIPEDEDDCPIIVEGEGIPRTFYIEVPFQVNPGKIVERVESRFWLLFNEESEEIAYRVVM